VVAAAVGADSRIGVKYLRPGGAYGGPCFPRDGLAFQQAADKVGLRAPLAAATDAVNYRQQRRTAATVARVAGRGARVAVLGTAYKPGTEVTERSFGEAVARELAWAGFDVVTHDPLADCTQPDLGLALDGADVAVLATDDPAWVAHTFQDVTVVDPWGLPIITGSCTYEAVA
jgi:UDPglucose 6-dehydrogenase